jgi:hypothetical protein
MKNVERGAEGRGRQEGRGKERRKNDKSTTGRQEGMREREGEKRGKDKAMVGNGERQEEGGTLGRQLMS